VYVIQPPYAATALGEDAQPDTRLGVLWGIRFLTPEEWNSIAEERSRALALGILGT
jgi:hypothetical protein